MKRSEYIYLAPVRGRLPRCYQSSSERDQVNWWALAAGGLVITVWGVILWRWLH